MKDYKIIKSYWFTSSDGYLSQFNAGSNVKGLETEKGLFVETYNGRKVNIIIPYEYMVKIDSVSETNELGGQKGNNKGFLSGKNILIGSSIIIAVFIVLKLIKRKN